jgi:hypothetical protein
MSTNFAEQWLNEYKSSTNPVSYRAFDYESIKRALIEYLQVYHPEYYNNLIETDELLPLIEMFAYVGDLYSYRADVNTQEHILTNATRKSSALQLATMLGYKPSRRVPATGLVKIVSVSTTETIIDSTGQNLRGRVIRWNDPINNNWQVQFNRVLNKALNSQIGTLSSKDKIDLAGAQVERYTLNIEDQTDGVYRFSVSVNGSTLAMELVSAELTPDSIIEERPTGARPLSILSINDGFGNSSPGTGFFFLTKQGTLAAQPLVFDGRTVNIAQTLGATGVNETDLWLNEVDTAGNVVRQWEKVDNVAYNQSDSRYTHEIETLEDDGVRLIFGDGSFAAIPNGSFDCWYRVSESFEGTIQTSALQNERVTFPYFDSTGNLQTLSIEISLVNPITNSAPSETLEKIKQAAPGVFYTQDRMVNGRDYQEFLLQDPSIVKTKAVNRTFAGHSKYQGWFEGSETYENVKIFGNDGSLFFEEQPRIIEVPNPAGTVTNAVFIDQYLEPQLDYPDLWLNIAQRLSQEPVVRKFFTTTEKQSIESILFGFTFGSVLNLRWNNDTAVWDIVGSATGDITVRLNPTGQLGWIITVSASKVVFDSPTTQFWDYRIGRTIDYDTRFPSRDLLTVLRANTNTTGTGVLDRDEVFSVVANYVQQQAQPNQALPDLTKIELVGKDTDGDQFPEDFVVGRLVGKLRTVVSDSTGLLTLSEEDSYAVGKGEILEIVDASTGTPVLDYFEVGSLDGVSRQIQLAPSSQQTVIVKLQSYVYFELNTITQEFAVISETLSIKRRYVLESTSTLPTVIRRVGRTGLNFLWQHFTDSFDLVDPARTNIVDIYVITRQFFSDFSRWVNDPNATANDQPQLPSYADLQLAYSRYLGKGMMSDEIVLRPGRFKVIFGPKARPELRGKIQLVVQASSASFQTIKSEVVELIREYFSLNNQNFGQTLFFSDLSRYVTTNSRNQISSMLLVPLFPGFEFGDLYQVRTSPDELLIPDISISDIDIVENITRVNLRQ